MSQEILREIKKNFLGKKMVVQKFPLKTCSHEFSLKHALQVSTYYINWQTQGSITP